jgi:hypothetical protein
MVCWNPVNALVAEFCAELVFFNALTHQKAPPIHNWLVFAWLTAGLTASLHVLAMVGVYLHFTT